MTFLTFFKYYKNVFFRVGTRLFLLIPKRIRIIPDHSSSRVSLYYQNYEFYILGSLLPMFLLGINVLNRPFLFFSTFKTPFSAFHTIFIRKSPRIHSFDMTYGLRFLIDFYQFKIPFIFGEKKFCRISTKTHSFGLYDLQIVNNWSFLFQNGLHCISSLNCDLTVSQLVSHSKGFKRSQELKWAIWTWLFNFLKRKITPDWRSKPVILKSWILNGSKIVKRQSLLG